MTAPPAQATAYYVYGVVPAQSELPLLDGAGLDAEFAPELLTRGALAAVASQIRVDAGTEPDPETVLSSVLAHEALLERLLEAGLPVVPFRFGAAYAEAGEMAALLAARETELLEALARVDGRVELGVKAYVDPERVAATARGRDERLAALEAELATASPGAAHLRRKQLERLAADAAAEERARRAAALHERLAAASVAARTNPLPEAGDGLQPILNGAYLVPRDAQAAFRREAEAAAAHADLALRADVTGPWPAYNFVEREG